MSAYIEFSNTFFYDNRLVTFPSARTDTNGRGVRLEYVSEGVWDRGRRRTNRVEARKVADLVVEHFTNFPNRSLGVAKDTYPFEPSRIGSSARTACTRQPFRNALKTWYLPRMAFSYA